MNVPVAIESISNTAVIFVHCVPIACVVDLKHKILLKICLQGCQQALTCMTKNAPAAIMLAIMNENTVHMKL